MLIAVMFWSIQTADACAIHADSGSSATMSVQADQGYAGIDISVDTNTDDAGKDGTKSPVSCADGCCHALHHAFVAPPESQIEIDGSEDVFALVQDARPDTHSSPLNRPPLA